MPSLSQAWARQIGWCDANGSPFTARVLEAAWDDRERGGALATLLPDWPGDAGADAVPLRVAGALHGLALSGHDAALAARYPPRAGTFDRERGPRAVAEAIAAHGDVVASYLAVAPQTNEIGRSAVLLGGFAMIAQATGLPLATLEIGASAGLNMLWHRFRYELGGAGAWGDPASPVRIRCDWQGAAPALPARLALAQAEACDLSPIDLRDDAAALRLLSYVWADQRERLERLRAAIALAQAERVQVQPSDALPWLSERLALPRPGRTTVLYHSVMWQYMPPPTRDALHALIAEAGARARPDAPLAWLAFEPPAADARMELVLTQWPSGERRVLATAHPHGAWARWA